MYVHEDNIETKIGGNYNGLEEKLLAFEKKFYFPMREKVESIDFSRGLTAFEKATEILNIYWEELHEFAIKNKIKSQSKFESTFLEEISCYLFHNIDEIKNGNLSIFNKGIYAGIKIKEDLTIDVIKKDVDFCIGKKINVTIDSPPLNPAQPA